MTGELVAVVLFAAFLHAGWNALIKSGSDKAMDTALIHLIGSAMSVPAVLWLGLPDPKAWPFLAASLCVHIGYYIALVGAYKHGDLGLTYPIMRGTAPLLVALGSGSLLSESLSLLAWAGVLAVSAGVLLLGASPGSLAAGNKGHALRYAFANATIIALYTFIDGSGVRVTVQQGGVVGQYVALLFMLDGLPYFAIQMWRRSPENRRQAIAYMGQRWRIASVGSVASIGSYAIALWAMTRAPIAAVAALRETSVLFAAVMGALWLREPFGVQRALGVVAIVAGVAALRLM
jgi:phosphonate utilization associated putative membrane protein